MTAFRYPATLPDTFSFLAYRQSNSSTNSYFWIAHGTYFFSLSPSCLAETLDVVELLYIYSWYEESEQSLWKKSYLHGESQIYLPGHAVPESSPCLRLIVQSWCHRWAGSEQWFLSMPQWEPKKAKATQSLLLWLWWQPSHTQLGHTLLSGMGPSHPAVPVLRWHRHPLVCSKTKQRTGGGFFIK